MEEKDHNYGVTGERGPGDPAAEPGYDGHTR